MSLDPSASRQDDTGINWILPPFGRQDDGFENIAIVRVRILHTRAITPNPPNCAFYRLKRQKTFSNNEKKLNLASL